MSCKPRSCAKLRYLDEDNERRRQLARIYDERLRESGVITPCAPEGMKHVYHLYVVRSSWRDELKLFLKRRGIGTSIHYPVLAHLQPAYSDLVYEACDFAHAKAASREVLSLPLYPELSEEDVAAIADAVIAFVDERESGGSSG